LQSSQFRKPYPTDVSEEEWAFVAPYLMLMREDAPQREYPLREIFNALRYLARCGGPWRMLPNDLPPWEAVYGQMRRWLASGVFERMAQDLREILRWREGTAQPTAAILDSRTLQSTPESGARAGSMERKRRKAAKCISLWIRSDTCSRCM
jgi:transposase